MVFTSHTFSFRTDSQSWESAAIRGRGTTFAFIVFAARSFRLGTIFEGFTSNTFFFFDKTDRRWS
jgi:hypothetical protein